MTLSALLLTALLVPQTAASQSTPATASVREAETSEPWGFEDSDIPVDPRIHFSSLDNGLRVAWANNGEPRDRVYVRLHVNVGSFSEQDSERGMAHFLEHMAFNGSENFEPGTLIEWFQEHGMSFGADTNAHTSFSETVYKLDMPARDETTLREGLVVMRDFAAGLTLDDEEVQNEKGVIDGEERERDSAGFRAFMKSAELQYAGTRIPLRIPIGTKEARDAFTGDSVRAFYERWYRPENMTLVLVGDLRDLNPEALVEEIFGDFKGPGTPVEAEPELGKPTMKSLDYAVHEPEIPYAQIVISRLKPFQERPDTLAKRKHSVVRTVAHAMLSLRFSEAVKQADTKYLQAGVSNAGGLNIFEGGDLTVISQPDQWQAGMTGAILELRKALEFGFQESELNEVRAGMRRQIEESVQREATEDSRALLGAILALAEDQAVPTNAVTDLDLMGSYLEELTVEDCHKALVENWTGGELSLVAIGSVAFENAGEQLGAIYESAMQIELEAPAALESRPFAYASDPDQAGAIESRTTVEDLDLVQVVFANGVRLNIKATDFKLRQIIVRARIGDGLLAMNDEELIVANVAGATFIGGGLVEHTSDELRRLTAGKQVRTGFTITDDHLALSSMTTSEDLLEVFELICAYMNEPGYRDDALIPLRAQLPASHEQLKHQPQGPLQFEFVPAFLKGNLRANVLSLGYSPNLEELLAVDMRQVQELLTPQLLKSDVELTVIGDLDVDEVIRSAARTFGVLAERDAPRDTSEARAGTQLVSGLKLTSTIDTQDAKATLVMLYPTDDGTDDARRRNLFFLGKVVADRLRLEVRERLGAAYSPFAVSEASRLFDGVGALMIQAAGDPAEIDALVAACEAVGADLAQNGVTQEEVNRLAEPIQNSLRDMLRTNNFWMNSVAHSQGDPSTLGSLRTLVAFYSNIDAEVLGKLAAEYLKPELASRLVVLPAAAESEESAESGE